MKNATHKAIKFLDLQKLSIFRLLSVFVCFGFLVFAGVTSTQHAESVCLQNGFVLESPKQSTFSINCTSQEQGLSWITWITSKSASNQFHFLDLLELLSRSSGNGD